MLQLVARRNVARNEARDPLGMVVNGSWRDGVIMIALRSTESN